jgi:hypothetical protein
VQWSFAELLHRQEISEDLRRVRLVCQSVPDRDVGEARELLHGRPPIEPLSPCDKLHQSGDQTVGWIRLMAISSSPSAF